MQPSDEEVEQLRKEQLAQERERRTFDSIQQVNRAEQQAIREQQLQQTEPQTTEVIGTDVSAQYQDKSNMYGSFGHSGEGTEEFITVENDLMKLIFSTKGGRVYSAELKNYQTYDSIPLILFNADTAVFGFNFFSKNKHLNTNDLYFQAEIPAKYQHWQMCIAEFVSRER